MALLSRLLPFLILMGSLLGAAETLPVPLGLPPIPWPADNPYSKSKAELGRLLYFDKRLSSDGTVACASCHSIPRAFTDRHPVSEGIRGRHGTRHAPTIINAAYQTHLFWDGRAATLEEQAKGPISNPKEMTLADTAHEALQQCHERVCQIKGYRELFQEVFGNDDCSIDQIAKAISTFERTILSGNSPYDRYMAGDKQALSQEQINGYQIFVASGCVNCHAGPNFSDGRFLNIGVGMDRWEPDLGRFDVTHHPSDRGAFKIPTLRDVANTYPYMHDGSFETLRQVVDYYDKGGNPNPNLNPLIRPLHLSEKEKQALVSFLESLSGEGWQHFSEPKHFPR
jgi:cytochrome c peroxidase